MDLCIVDDIYIVDIDINFTSQYTILYEIQYIIILYVYFEIYMISNTTTAVTMVLEISTTYPFQA